MTKRLPPRERPSGSRELAGTEERPYLLDVSVQLEDLTLALHLSHADLAG